MATQQELPVFDHSAADFNKVGPRRVYMEQYFGALGLWNADQVEIHREQRLDDLCTKLRGKRNKEVGQLYFEYMVDYGVWHRILAYANLSHDDHPWPHDISVMPKKKDFSKGVSQLYKGWVLRDISLQQSLGKSSAPHSEVAPSDQATPGPQTQATVVAKQESPAGPKDTVARYDPTIPFALQVRLAAAAKAVDAARLSSVNSMAPKTVSGMVSSTSCGDKVESKPNDANTSS